MLFYVFFFIHGMLCWCLHEQSCPPFCDPMDCSPPGPLFMGLPRQEDWSGLPFLSLGDLPHPGIKPETPMSPALAGSFFTAAPAGKPIMLYTS